VWSPRIVADEGQSAPERPTALIAWSCTVCAQLTPTTASGSCPVMPVRGEICTPPRTPDCGSRASCAYPTTTAASAQYCRPVCADQSGVCPPEPTACITLRRCQTAVDCMGDLPQDCRVCPLSPDGVETIACAHWVCDAGVCAVGYCENQSTLTCPGGHGCPAYSYPALDQACTQDTDCVVESHFVNCCQSELVGIATSEKALEQVHAPTIRIDASRLPSLVADALGSYPAERRGSPVCRLDVKAPADDGHGVVAIFGARPEARSIDSRAKRFGLAMASSGEPPAGKVMVVDDNVNVRNATVEYLRAQGYDVTACGSGKALLTQARWYSPPAVIVLDLVLQDMNGGQCLTALHESPWADVPVIIYSGWDNPERLGLNSQSIVRKTTDPARLVRSIDHLIAPRTSSPSAAAHRTRDGNGWKIAGR
jgi:CheY-like chemotaxis protein